jgi:hypothetical protein
MTDVDTQRTIERLTKERDDALRDLTELRMSDTTPPPSENPLSEYVSGLVRGALADFAAGATAVIERVGTRVLGDKLIEVATEQSRIRAEQEELKSQVQLCEGCPRRRLAGRS